MIVVTGSGGQLGTALMKAIPGAVGIDRTVLDLTLTDSIAPVLTDLRPDALINAAAFTAVDRAETEQELARTVNSTAVGEMARFAAGADIPFVTFSTDYVFDGTATEPYVESSPTSPVNAYGRGKLDGEHAAFAANPDTLVIRTSWVVSGTHPNFVATMLRLAGEHNEVRVVADQTGRPTIATDLAAATVTCLDRGATGLLHLTNEGTTTWFDLARTAVALAGGDVDRIQPCTTADYPTLARRPAYSVLGSERRADLGLAPLPDWRESIRAVVGQIAAGEPSAGQI